MVVLNYISGHPYFTVISSKDNTLLLKHYIAYCLYENIVFDGVKHLKRVKS